MWPVLALKIHAAHRWLPKNRKVHICQWMYQLCSVLAYNLGICDYTSDSAAIFCNLPIRFIKKHPTKDHQNPFLPYWAMMKYFTNLVNITTCLLTWDTACKKTQLYNLHLIKDLIPVQQLWAKIICPYTIRHLPRILKIIGKCLFLLKRKSWLTILGK